MTSPPFWIRISVTLLTLQRTDSIIIIVTLCETHDWHLQVSIKLNIITSFAQLTLFNRSRGYCSLNSQGGQGSDPGFDRLGVITSLRGIEGLDPGIFGDLKKCNSRGLGLNLEFPGYAVWDVRFKYGILIEAAIRWLDVNVMMLNRLTELMPECSHTHSHNYTPPYPPGIT